MKKYLKCVLALTLICAVVSVLMALTNSITAPIIEENKKASESKAFTEIYPTSMKFDPVNLEEFTLPETVTEAHKADDGGYVIKLNTKGLNTGMIILCGIDGEGRVSGAVCLESQETYNQEKTFGETLVSKNKDEVGAVDTKTGATYTVEGYKNAILDAFTAVAIFGGESVDVRTPEQILNDGLTAALPAANGEFSEMFIIEDLGVDAMYIAANKAGYVFVIGESFVATDMDGNVVSEASDELKAIATEAVAKVYASTMEEIDLSQYPDMPKAVTKANVTASGNYVFELEASGFGIRGDKYLRSNQPIKIRVSATPDGRIIATQTLSQEETPKGEMKFGTVCAEPSFYSQFNGKTAETYTEIDAITGATITTEGYVNAIARVFEAISILKGDA